MRVHVCGGILACERAGWLARQAEVMKPADFLKLGSEAAVREAGLLSAQVLCKAVHRSCLSHARCTAGQAVHGSARRHYSFSTQSALERRAGWCFRHEMAFRGRHVHMVGATAAATTAAVSVALDIESEEAGRCHRRGGKSLRAARAVGWLLHIKFEQLFRDARGEVRNHHGIATRVVPR